MRKLINRFIYTSSGSERRTAEYVGTNLKEEHTASIFYQPTRMHDDVTQTNLTAVKASVLTRLIDFLEAPYEHHSTSNKPIILVSTAC
jgi:hypothetical protein